MTDAIIGIIIGVLFAQLLIGVAEQYGRTR